MPDFKIASIRYTWKGTWTSSNGYLADDVIFYGGKAYVCLLAHTSSSSFATDLALSTLWVQMFDGYTWRGAWTPSATNTLSVISSSGNGTTATLVFATQSSNPFTVGQSITVGGNSVSGYNVTATVTAVTTSSVSYLNTTTTAGTGGTITSAGAVNLYNPGDTVSYGGLVYRCITSHTAAISTALGLEANQSAWTIVSQADAWKTNWAISTQYKVNDVVVYGGTIYRCITAHTSSSFVTTGLEANQSAWQIVYQQLSYKSGWATATNYHVLDVVQFDGTLYICNVAHQSTVFLTDSPVYWSIYLDALEFPGLNSPIYSSSQQYYKGDIVNYGGYSYRALSNNLNQIPDINTSYWQIVTENYYYRQTWSSAVSYTIGSVIRNDGYLYVCILDNYQQQPPNATYWTLLVPGRFWAGFWSTPTPYVLGDIVSYAGLSYECILAHTSSSGTLPATDVAAGSSSVGTYWKVYSLGDANNVLTTQGDTLWWNTGAKSRLPIGNPGQILKASSGTSLNWATFGVISKVYYVSSTAGTDTPLYGTSLNSPWATIAYACAQLIANGITGATIFIKTGTYTEVCPISVPANCSLVGDELRTTIVQPTAATSGNNMFYVRNGTIIRNMTLQGLTGSLGLANSYGTKRPTGGAFVSLDPGSGTSDSSVWITSKSPYVQNVTTFGTGCVGLKVDGTLHAGGYRSIVCNDFTQILSDGIGVWINSLGRSEAVSVFTYYNYIGYLCENGGKLRATNGNNSYGVYGSVAEGVYSAETPITAYVNNRATQASVGYVMTNTVKLLAFEYANAGLNYTSPSYTITGSGSGVIFETYDIRNAGIYEIRVTDPTNTGFPGGTSYLSVTGLAQNGTSNGTITLSASDTNSALVYAGMRIVVLSGTGAGQSGYIQAYNSTSKVATIYSEATGAQGWDLAYPGTQPTVCDNSSSYIIEPRVAIAGPGFSTVGGSLTASGYWASSAYGNGYFVTIDGQSQLVNYSTNGLNWNLGSGLPNLGATTSMVYSNGLFIATNTLTTTIAYSSNGTSFTSGALPVTTFGNSPIISAPSSYYGNYAAIVMNTGSRTNLLTYSNTLTNAAWTTSLSYIVPASVATQAPDGTYTAYKFIDNTSNAEHVIYYTRTNASPETVTFSIYAKAAERSQILVGFTNGTPSTTFTGAIINLATGGVITAPTSTGDYSGTSVNVTGAGNGWYRIAVTATHAVGTNTNNYPFIDVINNSSAQQYIGDGLSGLYLWGAQLEVGTRASAYVPTTTTTANGTFELFKTNNATTWIPFGSPTIGGGPLVYGNGTYVSFASTASNQCQYAINGITWATATLPFTQTWTLASFGNGVFIAVSIGSSNGAYSIDGINWYAMTLPAASQWLSVTFGQGLFMLIASGSTSNAQSQDGINWTANLVGTSPAWSTVSVSNPTSGPAVFVAITSGSNISSVMTTGATARARAIISSGSIKSFRIQNPGSGYVIGPTLTITDPNASTAASYTIRYGDRVLGQPTFISRGTAYLTAGAVITDSASTGYADSYQTGSYLNIYGMTSTPTPGSNVVISGNPTVYKLVAITNVSGSLGNQSATLQFDQSISVYKSQANATALSIRILYSQIRLTGHDFLSINSGNYVNTNYPINAFFTPSLATFQTIEAGGGHVFYTATDQDGNFTVGNIFGVAQATGTVTLSASLFNLSGLTQISLGALVVGSSSAIINTISTDGTMSANSDNTISTQRAIKTYIASRLGQGGGTSQVNSATMGQVQVVNDNSGIGSILTTTGNQINMANKVMFQGPAAGVDGSLLAMAYLMQSFHN